MKIYLDVLFLLNLFITFLLLKSTAKLTHQPVRRLRMLLASFAGGVYSLLILFDINGLLLTFCKLAMGFSLIFLAFFYRRQWIRFLKTSICFFIVNFVFAGFMLALWMFAPIPGMVYRNGITYFDISALSLAVSTVAAYLVITLVSWLWNKRVQPSESRELRLRLDGRVVQVNAFTDTGNKLTDIFTGLPVIVCEYAAAEALFPERIRGFFKNPGDFSFDGLEHSALARRLKVIPVQMAAGAAALPAFRPDELWVAGSACQAIVAVTSRKLSDGSFQALLPSALCDISPLQPKLDGYPNPQREGAAEPQQDEITTHVSSTH